MDVVALLEEHLSRVHEHVHGIPDGLSAEQLATPTEPGSNTIGWLLWHLTRVMDAHVAEILDQPQVWEDPTVAARFGLEPDPANTGYGHSAREVLAVRPEGPEAITDYYDAVEAVTLAMVRDLTPDALDRIVDRRWDPPVTLGVRLVSIIDDATQHAGQAAFVKGLLQRRGAR